MIIIANTADNHQEIAIRAGNASRDGPMNIADVKTMVTTARPAKRLLSIDAKEYGWAGSRKRPRIHLSTSGTGKNCWTKRPTMRRLIWFLIAPWEPRLHEVRRRMRGIR